MRRKGISMVEVLVVIAIIGILTAILFPVFSRAKRGGYRAQDITNMKSIHQALKLYYNDQGAYPPVLLQVAEYNGATLRNVADIRRGFLYKKEVKDITVFGTAAVEEKRDQVVQACWPNRDPRVTASQPNEYQFGGPGDLVTYAHLGIDPTTLNGQSVNSPAQFYAYDAFDVAQTTNPACVAVTGNKRYELRYILFWTVMGQGGGGPLDNTRQLGYRDPKDSTIVTWNSGFQQTKGTPPLPTHDKGTVVLYLNGSARLEDGRDVYDRSWRFGQ